MPELVRCGAAPCARIWCCVEPPVSRRAREPGQRYQMKPRTISRFMCALTTHRKDPAEPGHRTPKCEESADVLGVGRTRALGALYTGLPMVVLVWASDPPQPLWPLHSPANHGMLERRGRGSALTMCLPECGESSKGATARAWLGDAHSYSPPRVLRVFS